MSDVKNIAPDEYFKTDGITFEDLPYIEKVKGLLQYPNKEKALKLYTAEEPEPQQTVVLNTKYNENKEKIEKALQRLKSLEGATAAKQFQADQDNAWLDRVNAFKTHLLAILPSIYRNEGEVFLNTFIMNSHNSNYKEITAPTQNRYPQIDANYMPGTHPQKQGIRNKIQALYYKQSLQKFLSEFQQTNNEYNESYPRFDITLSTNQLKQNIAQQYDVSLLQQEKQNVNAQLKALTAENEAINQELNQKLASIAQKREKFSEVYNKKLFCTGESDSIVTQAAEKGLFFGTPEEKEHLCTLLNTVCNHSFVGRDIIRQSLEKGTKYFLNYVPSHDTAGAYAGGRVTLYVDSFSSPDNQFITIVHESKHALQDTSQNAEISPSFTNTYLTNCLKERDAQAAACAVAHDLKDIFPDAYEKNLNKTPTMQRAYSTEMQVSGDIVKAMNACALAWDKDFGESYKKDYCTDASHYYPLFSVKNPKIDNPEEIIAKNNITILGIPYLDAQTAVTQSLNVSEEVYARLQALNQMRINNGKEPDKGINYFSRREYIPNGKKDRFGLRGHDIAIIPGISTFKIEQNADTQSHIYSNAVATYPHLKKLFEEAAQKSPVFNEITNQAIQDGLQFAETKGLAQGGRLLPALYDKTNNRIILNKSFSRDEQLLSAAELMLSNAQPGLPATCNMKSQIGHHALNMAERTVKLALVASELSASYPLMQKKMLAEYPQEMTLIAQTGNKDDAVRLAFVSALANQKARTAVTDRLDHEIYALSNTARKQGINAGSEAHTPAELTKPFADRLPIAPSINTIIPLISQITPEAKSHLSYTAAKNNDSSLEQMETAANYHRPELSHAKGAEKVRA